MRRNFLPIVLALLFVCAQQAGLTHAIGHAAGTAATRTAVGVSTQQAVDQGTDGKEAESHCDKCFQFAHVAGVAFSFALTLLAIEPVREAAQASHVAAHIVDAPAFRSRGPPAIL
jgi:hypothetical protein